MFAYSVVSFCLVSFGWQPAAAPLAPAISSLTVDVPAGRFIAGCSDEPGCPAFNRPRREIDLAAFRIDRFEVTASAYGACVEAGGCGSASPSVDGQVPVEVTSIGEARAYCAWRGARLPTSDEWEKAARGTDGRTYPWGEDAPTCEKAAYCNEVRGDEIWRAVGDVGRHPAGRSPYGLEDVAGNAGEWTECGDVPDCVGIVRSPDHGGADGLRTYAGDVVNGALFAPGAGFRCVR